MKHEELVKRLESPSWCYDDHGQDLKYLPASLGRFAANALREQATRIEVLEAQNKALKELVDRYEDDGYARMGV